MHSALVWFTMEIVKQVAFFSEEIDSPYRNSKENTELIKAYISLRKWLCVGFKPMPSAIGGDA